MARGASSMATSGATARVGAPPPNKRRRTTEAPPPPPPPPALSPSPPASDSHDDDDEGDDEDDDDFEAEARDEAQAYAREKAKQIAESERYLKVGLPYRVKKERPKPAAVSKRDGRIALLAQLGLDGDTAEDLVRSAQKLLGKVQFRSDDELDQSEADVEDDGSDVERDGVFVRDEAETRAPVSAPVSRRAAALGIPASTVAARAAGRTGSGAAGAFVRVKDEEGGKGEPPREAERLLGNSHGVKPLEEEDDSEPELLLSRPPPPRHESAGRVGTAPCRAGTPALARLAGALDGGEDEEELLLTRPAPPRRGTAQTPPETGRAQRGEGEEEELLSLTATKPRVDVRDNPSTACVRPAFAPTPEQPAVGPLVLDAASGIEVPGSVNRHLREYQRDGVRFLYRCFRERHGGIVGDDMGLGKTVQVVAFLAAIMGKTGRGADDEARRVNALRAGRSVDAWPKCLIACPASVVTNWARELDTWGYFERAQLGGTERKQPLDDFVRGRLDVLIMTHAAVRNNIAALERAGISCVIVDEVHHAKSPRSHLTRALGRLGCAVRIGLTGTAIQNRTAEFWTLLDWADPGEFGRLSNWIELIDEPIRRSLASHATDREITLGRTVANAFSCTLLPRYFLRRTKTLIADKLPVKEDNIVLCPLTPLQLRACRMLLDDEDVELMRRAKEPCGCGRVDDQGIRYERCRCCFQANSRGEKWNTAMLERFSLLKSASNHLALMFPDPRDNDPSNAEHQFRYQQQLETVKSLFPSSWQDKTCNDRNGFKAANCGKWHVLGKLLAEWKGKGDKVLLFSNRQRLLRWIGHFVEMAGYRHRQLDGRTPQRDRQRLCDEFNDDPNVFLFLISTRAGGTGLNLTGANRVVIFDPDWNPANDLQAMDRAYRYGQKRDVFVYRLIGRGSFEEVVYGRQVAKQQLANVAYDAVDERRFFSVGDDIWALRSLFELQDGSLTRGLFEQRDVADANYEIRRFELGLDEPTNAKADEDKGRLESSSAPSGSQVAGGKGRRRTKDVTVAKILESAGITEVVRNDLLLGGSRAETEMSNAAMQRFLGAPAAAPPARAASSSAAVGLKSEAMRASGSDVKDDVGRKKGSLQRASSAAADVSSASSSEMPPLEWIAERQGCDVADVATRLKTMSDVERENFFGQLRRAWNRGFPSRHGRLLA